MKEILIWTALTVTAFIAFLATIIVGLIKKKRKTVLASIAVLLLGLCFGLWTAYLFTSKSYHRLTEIFRPRTGIEIYTALFGQPTTDCIEVLNYQDQVVPKIDYAIWLHYKTCPDELQRILRLHDFKTEIVSTKGWDTDGPLANENWFKPETLGDSIWIFTYNKDDYGNGQYIYSSLDSTRVFCKDVAD
jgi:hypothetical protein